MICPCKDSYAMSKLRRILSDQVKWYKQNRIDEDLLYDESWGMFLDLPRGAYQEILKVLSEK